MNIIGVADKNGQSHPVLGILDHRSRRILSLGTLRTKESIALLRCLIESIEAFGKPHALRTDNEAVFTWRLFRFGLWILGIRHQRTERHCSWQNGRIERFFAPSNGTPRRMVFEDVGSITQALEVFRFW